LELEHVSEYELELHSGVDTLRSLHGMNMKAIGEQIP